MRVICVGLGGKMDTESMHRLFIMLHAISGAVSFVAGCLLIFSTGQGVNRPLFGLYAGFLAVLVGSLLGAMIVNWMVYGVAERVIFSGLLGLGVYMLYRAWRAHLARETRSPHARHDYIEHIGFTVISLFEGFIILTVLRMSDSGWLVALFAILGVVAGRRMIAFAQRRGAGAQTLVV